MKTRTLWLSFLFLLLLSNVACLGKTELYIMGGIIAIIVIVAIIGAIQKEKKEKQKIQELGSERSYPFGKYLYGLKESQPTDLVQCVETDSDFVFIEGDTELGRIPAKAVTNIWVEDKSQVTSRFTATRIATLGIFALAAKKKKTTPSYYLTIEWKDGALTNSAIFEFSSLSAANDANNSMRQKIETVAEESHEISTSSKSSDNDIPSQIEKLSEMRDKGILTEEEYAQKKKELLEKM